MKIKKTVKIYKTYMGYLQIVIPKTITDLYELEGGQYLDVSFNGKNITMKKSEEKPKKDIDK